MVAWTAPLSKAGAWFVGVPMLTKLTSLSGSSPSRLSAFRAFVSDGVFSRFQVQLRLMAQENRRNVMSDAQILYVTLEAAGSYILNLGTVYRALFTTLRIEPGKTLFVEGAATGTGAEVVKAASRNRIG